MASLIYKKGTTGFAESTDAAFDVTHKPGTVAPNPGLYRCPGCKHIIAIAGGHQLPPQNHHTHSTKEQGEVRWQLVVSHTAN